MRYFKLYNDINCTTRLVVVKLEHFRIFLIILLSQTVAQNIALRMFLLYLCWSTNLKVLNLKLSTTSWPIRSLLLRWLRFSWFLNVQPLGFNPCIASDLSQIYLCFYCWQPCLVDYFLLAYQGYFILKLRHKSFKVTVKGRQSKDTDTNRLTEYEVERKSRTHSLTCQ